MHLVIRALAFVLIRVFYRTVATSHLAQLPVAGPVIIVANHPNGLLDPLVARHALRRPLAFLAKSTFFTHYFGRATMRAFDAIPVYRQQDASDTSKNEETFRRCRERLARGGSLMLFPEGTSHSDPQLKPLKTGAARIALSAEAAHDFSLGVQVVPVGLLYEDKSIFRSRVGVAVGAPVGLASYRERYMADERGAVDALTDEIDRALSEVVLEADSAELRDGIVAVAAWTSDDGGQDVARLETRSRELAQAYRALVAKDARRAQDVVEQTRRFAASLRAVGVERPFSLEPVRPRPAGVVAFALPLVTLWPLALVGVVLGWPAYRFIGFLANKPGTEPDVVATMKAVGALVVLVPWWIVEALAFGFFLGWPWGLAVAALGPLCGFVAIRYQERLARRREALQALWLRSSEAAVVAELSRRREELARRVAAELEAVRPSR